MSQRPASASATFLRPRPVPTSRPSTPAPPHLTTPQRLPRLLLSLLCHQLLASPLAGQTCLPTALFSPTISSRRGWSPQCPPAPRVRQSMFRSRLAKVSCLHLRSSPLSLAEPRHSSLCNCRGVSCLQTNRWYNVCDVNSSDPVFCGDGVVTEVCIQEQMQ